MGGVSSIDDIKKILNAGADRVSINTAGINNIRFLQEAVYQFGSSTIIVSIEAMKMSDGNYFCYTDYGRNHTNKNVFEWVDELQNVGVGEIFVTSVKHEGLGNGLDIPLYKKLSSMSRVPIVAHGGVGKKEHLKQILVDENVELSGISAASIFHYHFIEENDVDVTDSGNHDFLNNKEKMRSFDALCVQELKKYCISEGLCYNYNDL